MAEEKREKTKLRFTPEELAEMSEAIYGHAMQSIAQIEGEFRSSESERIWYGRLHAKLLILLGDTRYGKQVLKAESFDGILGEVARWQANNSWQSGQMLIQIGKADAGWEAEVWVKNEEYDYPMEDAS